MPRCIVRWPTEVVRYKGRTRDCGSQLHPGRPGKGDRDAWSAQRTHSQGCVQYQDMLYTLLSGDPLQRKVECQQRSTAVDRCWARSSSRTTLRQ